uniref:VWFA domain-containing protein n=1 Tax=Oryza punctata TaxID=4537 RepID=A0A0E0MI89_ORYPU
MGRLHNLMLLLACFFSTLLLSQVMSAAAGMTVKVSTTPIFPKIPRAQTNKDFQVLLRIEAPPPVDLKGRVPIDLVVVLDVGGGMSLEPVKKATKFAIRQLSDDDSLAILGPPMSREIIPKFVSIHGSRRIAEKKVDELEGRRFAHPARSSLDEALKMLEEQPASSSVGRAKFIVLVTDREDITRFNSDMPEWFTAALAKYPVHAFGLGASHDAAALRLIAQRSQGTYSFLDDGNVDKVAGALALCLGGLKSVTAVGARVVLKAASGSGVRIDRISSGGYASSISQVDRASGEIAIGALYAGEVKSFVVHLDVPAAPPLEALRTVEGVCCDQQQLLVASLDGQLYTSGVVDVDDAAPGGPIQDVLVVERPPAAVLPKVPAAIVVNHIFQFRVLEMVDSFISDEILRRTPVTGRKDVDVDLGTKLLARWEKFVLEHQFWVGLDLGSLDGEITAVANSLRKQHVVGVSSSTAAYIFSWMSSYKMQRPTAMGSPAKVVGVFVTLEVHLTLQVAITAESGGGGNDGECHDECEYSCVEQLPPAPPLLVASGHDDDSYRFNAAYEGVISLDDINQFMIKIYQGMVKANKLKQCHLMNQQPRVVA